ncbi:NUDIX domain-containing protein [Magnaporthiopsis poae ATCC 64411]|uniref:NUDIX domain-containing protein n=1 Tax=Magnaporthiopsis poae (strain ATCC 64411 / 73-15) TaxID=644358 RepID=A0A0C4E2S0_MAGP6|nr:NUDIX domain-containing protein [Magnaporthiopsis poae ATCC 64411]
MTAATVEVEHDSGPPAEKPFTEAEIASVIDAAREVSSSAPPSSDFFADESADYWDASTMGQLNEVSLAAVARLRSYRPPAFPLWDRLPVNRRAAVLILLYADRLGDLRVVITMRSATLRSFSGQAAFPGGKADSVDETPYQVAQREAWEEIGLPMDDSKIPAPFTIEQLCYLPHSLARTGLVVRPCVAFLHATATTDGGEVPTADYVRAADETPASISPATTQPQRPSMMPPGHWYEGRWTEYNGYRWRLHYFFVPVDRQRVTRPRVREGGQAALAEDPDEAEAETRFKVWGMTGRMLVDAARIAYAEEPEFEHNEQYGDEPMIEHLASQIVENKL